MSEVGRDPKTGRFLKGWKGGPGRVLGSRHELEKSFIQAYVRDFDLHGSHVIERVREEDPSTYLRIAAGLLPKDVNIHTRPAALSVEEFAERFRDLVARAGRATALAQQSNTLPLIEGTVE